MIRQACVLGLLISAVASAYAYPIDAYPETGIARLEFYRLAQLGEINGRQLPAGAQLGQAQIKLTYPAVEMDAVGRIQLPTRNAELSSALTAAVADEERSRYGIALLDFSNPAQPVYAEHRGDYQHNIGSVGKLVAVVGLLQQLSEIYPEDIEARKNLLRNTEVVADTYSVYDQHKVPIFDVTNRRLSYRRLVEGDRGSLWEFLDWMTSASSNGAASMVMQQATLMRQFGDEYPRLPSEHQAWLEQTPYRAEGEVTVAMLERGLLANQLDIKHLRQGKYFTRNAKRKAWGPHSYGQPRELIRLLYAMETGRLVDAWSSLELKRLLYLTQKRIRYASHPVLNDAAVYFKSGSLYGCEPEPGFECDKYQGNRINILASVAVVEYPAINPQLRYAVVVLSNVLKKNAAVSHQTLAKRIHALVEKRNQALQNRP
jgi:hypothetical protein